MQFFFDNAASLQALDYLLKLAGGALSSTVAMKLLYLADRESLRRWGTSITGAEPVNTENGPFLREVCDLVEGPLWSTYVCKVGDQLQRLRPVEPDDLSVAACELLAEIFNIAIGMTEPEIVEFCQKLPECQGSSGPIDPREILRAVGKNEDEIATIASETDYYTAARREFGSR